VTIGPAARSAPKACRLQQHSQPKKQLSRIVERAANGEPFVIAKEGKPLVKVCAVDVRAQRLDFLAGEIAVPDDFDRMDWQRGGKPPQS
jgi:antitoxin (DNA-binding transcriptional repressor) of toxin-antitoxin stability system